jgi:5-methylcytosine-specific restriction endonuclease McrA
MRRFCRYQLIGGATLCCLKRKKEYIDSYISNSALEIFYLSLWFINLISYRQNGGRRYRQGTWARLIKRDGRRCKICGTENELLTIDHVIPLSKGGHPKWIGNLQILCQKHNYEKGNS